MSHETVTYRPPETATRSTPPPPPPPVAAPKKRSLTGWIVASVLVVMALGIVIIIRRGTAVDTTAAGGRSALAGKAMPVVAVQARQGDMPVYIDGLLGNVTPYNTTTIIPRVTGQVMKIYFKEGQLVKVGDPLFDIDERPYQAQLEQAEAQLAKDQALLKGAQNDLKLYQDSEKAAPGSVTDQQIEDQQALVGQDAANVQADNATIDGDKLNLTYCKITSPIDGRIGLELVTVGNLVQSSNTSGMAVIAQIQPITVVFHPAEDDLPRIMAKMPNDGSGDGPEVDAYNRDESVLLAKGKLYAVDSQVDPTTGTIAMKAEFPNEDGSLFPNEFVDVRLLLDTLNNVVIVPASAVQQGPDSTFVWVVDSTTHKVSMRTVTTGPQEGDRQQIVSGLKPGETVVTQGVDKLVAGMVVAPMTPQEAGVGGPATQPTTRTGHRHPHTQPAPDAGGGDQ